jgi:hypothetical protein
MRRSRDAILAWQLVEFSAHRQHGISAADSAKLQLQDGDFVATECDASPAAGKAITIAKGSVWEQTEAALFGLTYDDTTSASGTGVVSAFVRLVLWRSDCDVRVQGQHSYRWKPRMERQEPVGDLPRKAAYGGAYVRSDRRCDGLLRIRDCHRGVRQYARLGPKIRIMGG